MRSRYAAYAAGLVDYILATTDPAGPMWQADEAAWRAQIADFSRRCTFLGVDITEASSSGDDGQVTFHAKLRAGDDDVSFTETSRFRRVGERWFYVGAV
jgi:SEC-C motif-containing protein